MGRRSVDLVARFIAEPDNEDLRSELEDAYRGGLPTETLRPLLRSGNPELVGAALYWTWDVVDDVAPVLTDLCDVLDSEKLPRGYVVASIRQARTVRGDVLPRVLDHLDDPDDQVAVDVIYFLSELDPQQLDVLVRHVDDAVVTAALIEHLSTSRLSPQKVRAGLADPDVRVGRIATAKVEDKLRYAEHPRRASAAVTAEAEQLLYDIRDGSDRVAAKAADQHLFSMWSDEELEPRHRRDRWRVKWFHFKVFGPTPKNVWENLTFRMEDHRRRNDPDW